MSASWNLWHGCEKISAGCANCYVYRTDAKYNKDSAEVKKTRNFDLPVKKNRKDEYKIAAGETVYTCFTSDFFIDKADKWRAKAWELIRLRNDLNFIIITKRIDRFCVNLPSDWGDGYNNVMIGCTVENMDRARYRLPIFFNMPIKHRIIICEPLLEKLDLTGYLSKDLERVVVGGESGSKARVCDYDWVLDIKNQCSKNGVAFTFKQTGAKLKKGGKVYRIERKYQHSQARKANINT